MVRYREGLLDRLLLLTTSKARAMPPGRRKGWDAILPDPAWTVRRAGPRWFALWDRDRQRLRRLRILLLPEDWLGLSAAQETALALEQLRPAEKIPAPFSTPLHEARAKLRRIQSRLP
ncbi:MULTISPECIES: hypothetical protein [Paracoccus]|jgi:hypothetical protein|uniref:Uncharacterized protein n=1 Tax=Paracoccus denitrificans (strain Pd 1222) TaxID=318586 RepID=A1BCD6_PARDP|nr:MULTISPECIES: hypothetical protein [Paracoccus]ABL73180.1 hypothetical protein Pden_5120 [Paracoccus denitrificans PD1222]MBB4628662.1 hypothetical protein [Paracoccus denitrificans]MCU7429719.1 hypothetical protein [Paracoccus denitrificans]MDK8871338.1 hypothetical protein [Paracoccus sp. SSJ]QAR29558.1 hypothetical protein EO213_24760 [Paracoccus denitrificans]